MESCQGYFSDEDLSNSDEVDSEIEAELYSIIHHEMDSSMLQNDSTDNTNTLASNTFSIISPAKVKVVKSNVVVEFNSVTNISSPFIINGEKRNFNESPSYKSSTMKRKSDLVVNVLNNIQVSASKMPSLETDDSPASKKLKKEKNNNLLSSNCGSKKNVKKSPNQYFNLNHTISESDSSDDSVIIIEPDNLDSLQTNINEATISVSSDSESSSLSDMDSKSSQSLRSNFLNFNQSLPNIKLGGTHKGSWHVNNEDLLRRRRHSGRYHERAALKCTNCSQTGHSAKSCPSKKALKCFICGENHSSYQCKNRVCHKCLSFGHDSRFCKFNAQYSVCEICKMRGHTSYACPDNWRRYHLTTTSKKFKKGKPQAQNRPLYCYNCGMEGHFGPICKEHRDGYASPKTWPCVITYCKGNANRQSRVAPSLTQTPNFNMGNNDGQPSTSKKKERNRKRESNKPVKSKTRVKEVDFPRSPNPAKKFASTLSPSSKHKRNEMMKSRRLKRKQKRAQKFLRMPRK